MNVLSGVGFEKISHPIRGIFCRHTDVLDFGETLGYLGGVRQVYTCPKCNKPLNIMYIDDSSEKIFNENKNKYNEFYFNNNFEFIKGTESEKNNFKDKIDYVEENDIDDDSDAEKDAEDFMKLYQINNNGNNILKEQLLNKSTSPTKINNNINDVIEIVDDEIEDGEIVSDEEENLNFNLNNSNIKNCWNNNILSNINNNKKNDKILDYSKNNNKNNNNKKNEEIIILDEDENSQNEENINKKINEEKINQNNSLIHRNVSNDKNNYAYRALSPQRIFRNNKNAFSPSRINGKSNYSRNMSPLTDLKNNNFYPTPLKIKKIDDHISKEEKLQWKSKNQMLLKEILKNNTIYNEKYNSQNNNINENRKNVNEMRFRGKSNINPKLSNFNNKNFLSSSNYLINQKRNREQYDSNSIDSKNNEYQNFHCYNNNSYINFNNHFDRNNYYRVNSSYNNLNINYNNQTRNDSDLNILKKMHHNKFQPDRSKSKTITRKNQKNEINLKSPIKVYPTFKYNNYNKKIPEENINNKINNKINNNIINELSFYPQSKNILNINKKASQEQISKSKENEENKEIELVNGNPNKIIVRPYKIFLKENIPRDYSNNFDGKFDQVQYQDLFLDKLKFTENKTDKSYFYNIYYNLRKYNKKQFKEDDICVENKSFFDKFDMLKCVES